MTCRKFCIVIALMVLSVSAILVAREPIVHFSQGFSSTLNGVPVQVRLFARGRGEEHVWIKPMRFRELQQNWDQYVGRFVRFTGVAGLVETSFRTKQVRKITLEGNVVDVYPLDVPNPPETYERGHKYEFTGLLIRCESHAEYKKSGYVKMRVYAFEIRHLGEAD